MFPGLIVVIFHELDYFMVVIMIPGTRNPVIHYELDCVGRFADTGHSNELLGPVIDYWAQ